MAIGAPLGCRAVVSKRVWEEFKEVPSDELASRVAFPLFAFAVGTVADLRNPTGVNELGEEFLHRDLDGPRA